MDIEEASRLIEDLKRKMDVSRAEAKAVRLKNKELQITCNLQSKKLYDIHTKGLQIPAPTKETANIFMNNVVEGLKHYAGFLTEKQIKWIAGLAYSILKGKQNDHAYGNNIIDIQRGMWKDDKLV